MFVSTSGAKKRCVAMGSSTVWKNATMKTKWMRMPVPMGARQLAVGTGSSGVDRKSAMVVIYAM
jgi:hypothetical protein